MNILLRTRRPSLNPGRTTIRAAALTALSVLTGVGIALVDPTLAHANVRDPQTGAETSAVGLALAWTPTQLGNYSPGAANFSLYDEHGQLVDVSTCESVTAGSGLRFPTSSAHNRMPTDKNMSFTLTLYATRYCHRDTALWDYSGVPTANTGLEYQWVTRSDWEEFSGTQPVRLGVTVSPGNPGHSWFAGYHCPATCPR